MNQIQKLGNLAESLGCEVRYQEPMSLHTTFRIGGPADVFLTVGSTPALQKICRRASELGIPIFPLGNGSNLLVSDAGIRGAVVTLDGDFKKIALCSGTSIQCGSGASLASVCNFAKGHALTGLEFAWGIPGSAGGAAFMNAGAYEHCVSEVISSCSHVTATGNAGILKKDDLDFGYRHSAYSSGGSLITSIRLKLKRGNENEISARMEDLYARRKAKQPLELPSAGSVFKRPEGHFAGALIQQCGLKGTRVGGAAVSEKHAGFIVNLGGATCADVRKLIETIQETVLRQTGVRLECEVKAVG
ncbi:MAG: UDP-N-acetylmuramate dehydrogenase [Oscillospiraceae bacterium]|jgi:UDP-N-acetylmuramate dehydrogenase|nr:UDP-N-acetylmuramate dehydrogenase [Oscillospiraceae bacterium]MCI1990859.1 UDP-N-acetylmuramate dehydrogenase [Oscillospiraceae bacterium]MCI2035694.1 UDP-N-acetylmuramate dehydrogenase [Oscillospiraceae bacterium]